MSDAFDQAQAQAGATAMSSTETMDALRPVIVGPQAALFRRNNATEKALSALGPYVSGSDTNYDWPNKPAGAVVDLATARLHVDNALLRYFSDSIGAGDTIAPVASQVSRVRAVATRWKTANGFTRTASLLDRDVKVGDAVYLSDGSNSLSTRVHDFGPEVIAASIAAATADAGNSGTQGSSSSISQTSGTVNDVVATRSIAAYSGLKDGAINETYTIIVIQAPTTPGDATTARLSVTSSSGLDNQASVTPALYGRPTPIGTRGATVTFSHTSSDFVLGQTWSFVIAQAFTAVTGASSGTYTGEQSLSYIITVTRGGYTNAASSPIANPTTQATVAVTGGGSSGGTLPAGAYFVSYTFKTTEGETTAGTSESATFTVASGNIPRVTVPALPNGAVSINIYLTNTAGGTGTEKLYRRDITSTTVDLTDNAWDGGTFANSTAPPGASTALVVAPQVTAVDSTGVDASGPTVVPLSGAVSIGSFGVVLTFAQTKMRKGDIFHANATAQTQGAVQTLVLEDALSPAMQGASDLTIKLYIKKDFFVPEQRAEAAPAVNGSVTATQVTAKGVMTAFDSSWTSGGSQAALPVESGDLFVQYRAWVADNAGQVTTVSTSTDLLAKLGTYAPDNPLCYAAAKCLLNANNTPVRFLAVGDPSIKANWDEALTILDRLRGPYGIVPLTRDPAVLTAFRSHVIAQSEEDVQCWRTCWWSPAQQVTALVVDATVTSDNQPALATLADNPGAAGTQYTLLTCTTGNAKFVTNGVRAGDTVRYLFSVDGFGNSSWKEFLVASVVNEDQLILDAGHTSAVTTAQRVEIWRDRTRPEIAQAIATQIRAQAHARWLPVWPDALLDGNTRVDGFFLAAALAGLVGGVPTHQSLPN